MPKCIFCEQEKSSSAFSKPEHVLLRAFCAGFAQPIVLLEGECDECNQEFGNTIDRYLARGTPHGLRRFILGQKRAKEFKPASRKDGMSHYVRGGPRDGMLARYKPVGDALEPATLPQIGFSRVVEGEPYEFLPLDPFPTREDVQKRIHDGKTHIHIAGVPETELPGVLKKLEEIGCKIIEESVPDSLKIPPGGIREYIETKALLGDEFGRAIAKIGLNYLASQYGVSTALLPQFDTVRRCVFEKRSLPRGGWVSGNYPIIRDAADVGARGHILALDWQPKLGAVIFRISLYTQESTYGVRLSYGAFNLSPAIEGRAHFYNLATKKVESATRVEQGIALL